MWDLTHWRQLGNTFLSRPIWPDILRPTARCRATIHTDASLTAYGATLGEGAQCAGAKGYYETQGFWDPRFRETAHITIMVNMILDLILELMTVRISIMDFIDLTTIRQAEIIKLYTDNMVVSHIVSKMCSKSPLLMAELMP